MPSPTSFPGCSPTRPPERRREPWERGGAVTVAIGVVMHQSIPAVPNSPLPPPFPGNRGAFAQVVSPGGGSLPGGWALAYPGATPGHLTHVFELTWKSLSEKTRPSLKTGLSVTDSKNLWMFLKVCFLNFSYFFIYTCKHMNI